MVQAIKLAEIVKFVFFYIIYITQCKLHIIGNIWALKLTSLLTTTTQEIAPHGCNIRPYKPQFSRTSDHHVDIACH